MLHDLVKVDTAARLNPISLHMSEESTYTIQKKYQKRYLLMLIALSILKATHNYPQLCLGEKKCTWKMTYLKR